MLNKRSIALVLLICLLLPLATSQAQIAHEDPDRIPVHKSYDADRQLAMALERMFGSLDSLASHINASDFTASRNDIELFSAAHADFAAVCQRVNLSGTDMEAIAAKLEYMDADLWTLVNSSEASLADLYQYNTYQSANDAESARQLAARMQQSSQDANDVLQHLNRNTTDILNSLGRTSAGAQSLQNGIAGLNGYMAKVNVFSRQSSGLPGNTKLALSASSQLAGSGEHVGLTATLTVADASPAGRLVYFFIGPLQVGSGVTDRSGTCTFDYPVSDRSFGRTMLARAELDFQGSGLYPARSNFVEIARRPEQAILQVRVTPGAAEFADTLCVYGTLAGTSWLPAAGRIVNISLAGVQVGNATTDQSGYYSTQLVVGPYLPAGECSIGASYEGTPDSALTSGVSSPGSVYLSPTASRVSLDPPGHVYQGGELAVFNGSLTAVTGTPAEGANVSVFAGGAWIGQCQTDTAGKFSLVSAIPFNVTPGDQDVYASFDPGPGRTLSASRSVAYTARFEPVVPEISLNGAPLLVYPGDELELDGVMTANGRPVGDSPICVSAGAWKATVTTDAGGYFQLACPIPGGPGIYGLSVGVPDGGLLSGTGEGATIFLVLPFGRTILAIAAIIILLIAGLIVKESQELAGEGKMMSAFEPTTWSQFPDGTEEGQATPGVGDALDQIDRALSGEKDRREAVLSAYLAARRMLHEVDPDVSDSATHRELCRMIAGQQPSLSAPLGVITRCYEGTAFRHAEPTDEDVGRSLRSLKEIMGQLYGKGGAAP